MSRYFTKDHEWIEIDGDTGTVGITDYAQGQLGDITFVEPAEAGRAVKQGDCACVIDSVKAASDVYAPVSGEITEANDALEDAPESVNSAAESEGWLYRMRVGDPSELGALMDKAAYDAYVAGL